MKINLELIKSTKNNLDELGNIVQQKIFDKSVVLERIKTINHQLSKLNTITKKLRKEHKQRETGLYDKFDQQHQAFEQIHQEAQKFLAAINEYDAHTNPPDESPSLDISEERQKELMKSLTIDTNEVGIVLNNYFWRRMTRKRKWWLWSTNFVFLTRHWTHQIGKLIISAVVGFGLEKLLEFKWDIPDFAVFAPITVLLFFTLDRFMDKRIDQIFWKRVFSQSIILYTHLKIYTDHLIYFLDNKKK